MSYFTQARFSAEKLMRMKAEERTILTSLLFGASVFEAPKPRHLRGPYQEQTQAMRPTRVASLNKSSPGRPGVT